MQSIKRVIVLINPTAASHQAKCSWEAIVPRFELLFSGYECTVVETESREHTIEIAATTPNDLIIAVGGDGTIHDVLQGLMRRSRDERPVLSVVPIGSGNDYARTLGIPSDPGEAIEALSGGRRVSIDVGRCNDSYFLETLSFGVDAAIALRTEKVRLVTKQRGILLYMRSAVSTIIHELKSHKIRLVTDTGITLDKKLLICAIQIGPTYGGGFIVAPKAVTNDGLLNISMGSEMSIPNALYHMILLSCGKHEKSSKFIPLIAKSITLDLEAEVPAQFDGEKLTGTHFEIECLQTAIDLIVPANSKL